MLWVFLLKMSFPLNLANIRESCLSAGHRDSCWTGQSQCLPPQLRKWEMSLQALLQPEEKVLLLTCTAHQPKLLLCSLYMGYQGDGPLKECKIRGGGDYQQL